MHGQQINKNTLLRKNKQKKQQTKLIKIHYQGKTILIPLTFKTGFQSKPDELIYTIPFLRKY